MTPSEYVDTYLRLNVWLGDMFVFTRVQNYLKSDGGKQAVNAKDALGKLTTALAARLNIKGPLPAVFEVEGVKYISTSLSRVYIGKGAPDEIQSALWLASLCGLVDATTRHAYADTNLGMDCGGLVANFWGIGRPTLADTNPEGATGMRPRYIWGLNPSLRRGHPRDIEVGDAAVFFQDVLGNNPNTAANQNADGTYDTTSGSQAFHIGLVSSVSWMTGTNTITLEIAESSGAPAQSGGNGVNVRSLGQVETTVANKLVYCMDGTNRIYFAGCNGTPSTYLPDSYGA